MKRAIAAILTMILLTMLFCPAAMGANTVSRIFVGKHGASLRDSPKGNKIGSVHGNTWLDVYDVQSGWYLVSYNGNNGWVSDQQVEQKEIRNTPDPEPTSTPQRRWDSNVPYIAPRVYGLDQYDWSVIWVQTQLKATGVWYQGDEWLISGKVGKKTMSEIRSFMNAMGNSHHTGVVDQSVIDALCEYLGDGIVYVDPNAKGQSSGRTRDAHESSHTERCDCGGVMVLISSVPCYTWDEFGHYKDAKETYKCQTCGSTYTITPRIEGNTFQAHTFNSYNICTVCGYDRGD